MPFLPLRRQARAAGRRPTRLVLAFHPNGLEAGWQPQGGETDFRLGPVLAPLEPFRSKLMIVGGLRGGIRNEVQGHAQGMTSLWTGARIANDADFAGHPSIDQIAADRLGAGLPFRSLEFGVQSQPSGRIDNGTVMIYAGGGKPVQAEDDPNRMFDRLFGMATDAAGIERVRREKKSVLDVVKAQLGRVRDAYGGEAQRIVDDHAAHVMSIEKRLAGLGAPVCTNAFTKHKRTGIEVTRANAVFPEMGRLQMDLLALSLGCGLTRVASLQMTNSTSGTQIPRVNDGYGIHTVMHTRTRDEKVRINKFFIEQLAYLLGRLDAQKLGDGTTVLDETLIVWGSEMAVGNHLNFPVPFILAGGAATGLRTGRWVNVAGQPRHTRLLVSVLHALGLEDVESVGDFRAAEERGPLPEVWG
jgi:hypothetical protein